MEHTIYEIFINRSSSTRLISKPFMRTSKLPSRVCGRQDYHIKRSVELGVEYTSSSADDSILPNSAGFLHLQGYHGRNGRSPVRASLPLEPVGVRNTRTNSSSRPASGHIAAWLGS